MITLHELMSRQSEAQVESLSEWIIPVACQVLKVRVDGALTGVSQSLAEL